MAKCIDCAWYPWMPGADVSMLPMVRCSPKLSARRWTIDGMIIEHECPGFIRNIKETSSLETKDSAITKEKVELVVPKAEESELEQGEVNADDTDSGTEETVKKTPKRTNTGRKDRRRH